MIREIAITAYLAVFRMVFYLLRCFPQQEKTVFVTYFGDNVSHVVASLEKKTTQPIIIAKTKHSRIYFSNDKQKKILNISGIRPLQWLAFNYHLATATTVMVDNYYGFLAATPFKKNVTCVQLWHAAGAIKKFGLKDKSLKDRTKGAIKRFNRVYSQFDHVVVGSEEMADIYQQSFGIEEEKILRTGIPRTDFFFNEEKKEKTIAMLYRQYPILKDKRVILYAPTFRDHENISETLALDIRQMKEQLGENDIILLKLHPIVKNKLQNNVMDHVLDVSHYENVNHLLLVTDILITDYSSIPFEYALLEKPMIFFAYDLEHYEKTRGIWKTYSELIPYPYVQTTDEVIQCIKEDSFDRGKIRQFKEKWNEYSTGSSSDALIDTLYKKD